MADDNGDNKPTDESTSAGQAAELANQSANRRARLGYDPRERNSIQKNGGQMRFSDPSNVYANTKQLYITISYPAADKEVAFKAFITDYSDTFTANWNKEELIQRNDIIATYKNTTRTVSVGWAVPCASLDEAKYNLQQTSILMRFLYGTYAPLTATGKTAAPGTMVLNQPPLLKVKFSNLIKEGTATGLYMVVSSISFSPDLDAGFFDPDTHLYPKSWNLSLEGDVIHEEKLGFTQGSEWRGDPTFPYLTSDIEVSKDFADEKAPFFKSFLDPATQAASDKRRADFGTGQQIDLQNASQQAENAINDTGDSTAAMAEMLTED